MHKENKGKKKITESTNHTQVIQNSTYHITDAARYYMTQKPLTFFHPPQNTEHYQKTFTVQ